MAAHVEEVSISSFLDTKPGGITEQPDFLHGAVKLHPRFPLEELNRLLKNIEDELGRDRTTPKFGPRTMDLDIVVWNDKIIDPDYYTRDFLKSAVDQLR
jgi:2-amino-4-hydroxy-6-hydroxymethyldihydropteridine diphosphokinase